MAKVKIQGNASGTGVITLIAPNTNTDRTITLPDESITLAGGVDGIVSTATGTAITIDSSDNVGIGVAPSAASWDTLQIGDGASLIGRNGNFSSMLSANATYNSGNKYINTGYAAQLEQYCDTTDVQHIFKTADSGSSGGAITWKTQLKIMNDGRGLSQFTAKAWACVNQQGTQSILDSHNISSINDSGSGFTDFYFINNMANNNYSAVGSSVGSTNGDGMIVAGVGGGNTNPHISSQVRMLVSYGPNNTATDITNLNLTVFGD